MSEEAKPKPMPLTSMPDRVEPKPKGFDYKEGFAAGIKSDRPMAINPGRR